MNAITPDEVLVIYSVAGTPQAELDGVRHAVEAYRKPRGEANASVSVSPIVFGIPASAAPGKALSTDLMERLRAAAGAIVFVDDLRPNVAYELGVFHGMGRPVLLVTRNPVEGTWLGISDLAGAPLANLNRVDLAQAVEGYLDELYRGLASVRPWPVVPLPSPERNRLWGWFSDHRERIRPDGPFGPVLVWDRWVECDAKKQLNLGAGARFHVALRAGSIATAYSLYFHASYALVGRRAEHQIWLGLTSRRLNRAGIHGDERTIPAQAPTDEWRMLTGTFEELLRAGGITAPARIHRLDTIRVRAGYPETPPGTAPLEIGFLEISGLE